jgi:hypothetical protein
MFVHPSIHLEISRQRQQALLGECEGDRIAKVLLADTRAQREAASRHEPSPKKTARLLRRATA